MFIRFHVKLLKFGIFLFSLFEPQEAQCLNKPTVSLTNQWMNKVKTILWKHLILLQKLEQFYFALKYFNFHFIAPEERGLILCHSVNW